MADYRKRELTTKDDVPLSELLNIGYTRFDVFNEAERPFRNILAQTVSEPIFRSGYTGNMMWEEIAEGAHARTGDINNAEVNMHVAKYARSLGFTAEFIEDNPASEVTKRFDVLAQGALEKEYDILMTTLDTGISDGSKDIWYGATEYGAYSFAADHDHVFADSTELVGSGGDTATGHVRAAAAELIHHGKRPAYALMSNEYARAVGDELVRGTGYEIPIAEQLRTTSSTEYDLVLDGVRYLQSPHISGYDVYVVDDSAPIYLHEKRPMQLTAGANGTPVGDPGALVGAYGSMRLGMKMVDPLAGVKFTADNIV